ncbi:motility protein A [Geothermobacter hydrogeniphilus]|uniref:Motility protein A n=1 Tax=Geothermobacter hydrogeniphilus TaxID=1969733 RepID=A0A2K2HCU1_9BACT|nr:MotA/TolQ/ExbB proton channel family protein [Geothermobacter hydrogeniphilus]PNU21125.1 motility protein A [Geothermobacter hydrogeniphilus]
MDLSTILGILAAFGLMFAAMSSGGNIGIFIDIPSVMIVVGGTVGTVLVHFPFGDVFSSISVFKKAILHKSVDPKERVKTMVEYAGKARKEGVLSLQSVLNNISDPFLEKGLQMAVDGQEPDTLKELLDREIDYIQERHDKGADIFIAMGTYAPAMGMIGTLIGLVQMLQSLSDPSSIGPAMAVALLTTFYGAIIANVFCMPISGKLKGRSATEVLDKSLIAEGLKLILKGENPRIIEQKLHAFIAPKLRESNFNN